MATESLDPWDQDKQERQQQLQAKGIRMVTMEEIQSLNETEVYLVIRGLTDALKWAHCHDWPNSDMPAASDKAETELRRQFDATKAASQRVRELLSKADGWEVIK